MQVGFFRRSRTIKGKRAPPACKEVGVLFHFLLFKSYDEMFLFDKTKRLTMKSLYN